jgi:hypothetical protein
MSRVKAGGDPGYAALRESATVHQDYYRFSSSWGKPCLAWP